MTPSRSDYEAAARAANLRIEWPRFGDVPRITDGPRWCPRTDDGDSRRLQVAARIHQRISDANIVARHDSGKIDVRMIGTDPCAAAREAVWRVAVAVGKEMGDD